MRSRWRRMGQAAGWAFLAIAALLAVIVALGLREAVAEPVMREANVSLDQVDRAARPYKIALLSDIHIGNRAMDPARLNRIVRSVNAAQPDLVVIAGDFVNGTAGALASDPQALVSSLSALQAPDGTIAVLGNHDHWTAPAAVRAALAQADVTVLGNQTVERGPLWIAGIDDHYSGHADVTATMQALPASNRKPVIVLTHSPDLAPALPSAVTLVLAGHTHCGQMVLPVIGPLAPVFGKLVGDRHYYDARFECGLVKHGSRTIIVTAGVGSGSIPMRLGAPPDWWLVTVRGR